MTVQGFEIEPIGPYAVACSNVDENGCPNDGVVRIEGLSFCGTCARLEMRALGIEPNPEREDRIR